MIHIQLHKSLLAASGQITLKVDLQFKEGDFIAIHGPSGSGKTTLLRLIAGLLRPEQGKIQVGSNIWLDTTIPVFLPPQQRDIGLVFQDYALFPNMTVRENLNFALKKKQAPHIIDELMEMTDLSGLANRRPQQLSGGQQQRVALARSLVRQPKILLMDEPLSALDPEMRAHLQDYILKTHQAFHLTTILVSHDVNEIVRLADRVLVMRNGKIEQSGSAEEVLLGGALEEILQLKGIIKKVYEKEKKFFIHIKIGENQLEVAVSKSEVKQLEVGDPVLISTSSADLKVKKMT